MSYPVSDHCDGTLFFNPEPAIRRSGRRVNLLTFARARMSRDPAVWSAWPKHVSNKPYPPPAETPPPAITFIGHASFLVRLPGLTFLTDPVFSRRCSPSQAVGPKRVRAPGVALENLPPIDLILLSHNHYDHMDLISLRRLRNAFPRAAIVTSLGNTAYLASKKILGARELDWWEHTIVHGARITATPARHFAARTLWDRNRTLWCGFMLEHHGRKIYFAGDTGYTRYFHEINERLGAPELALLPIGAYAPRDFMAPVHMNPEDAVKAFADLKARRALGMHFGTFQLTAEAIDRPLIDLAAARDAAGIGAEHFTTLDVGETGAL